MHARAYWTWMAIALLSLPAWGEDMQWTSLPPLPNAKGVAGPFVGVSGGALMVAGGANFPEASPWEGGKKVWYDQVYRLDSPTSTWQTAGVMRRPLGYGVSITTPEGVLCIGGSDAERHYASVDRLSVGASGVKSESLPDLPMPLALSAGALVEGVVYVAGGANKPGETGASGALLALDLHRAKPVWERLPALPGKPRILAAAAGHAGSFYVFGGVALEPVEGKVGRVYLRDAWRYAPDRGWEPLADLPHACAAAPSPCPVTGNTIWILGGDDGTRTTFKPLEKHSGFNKTIMAYDTRANTWRIAGDMPAAPVTTSTVEWANGIVVPSGEIRPGVRTPASWHIVFQGNGTGQRRTH